MVWVHSLWSWISQIRSFCSNRGFWQRVLHGTPCPETSRAQDLFSARYDLMMMIELSYKEMEMSFSALGTYKLKCMPFFPPKRTWRSEVCKIFSPELSVHIVTVWCPESARWLYYNCLSKMSTVSLPVLLLSFPCLSLGKFSVLYCNIIICHMINPKVLARTFTIVGIKWQPSPMKSIR